jgi:hypothetical protein
MGEITYNYGGSDEELYQTNLYSGSDADLDNTAPVDDTDGYTSGIDLTSKIFAVIDFKFDASGATDDLILKLFRRNDSSWEGDEIAIDEITVSSDGTEDIFSYVIGPSHGPGHYRFSMQSGGASDTFDIDVQMRRVSYVSA